MRCENITDDDLWSVIAENTNAMSLLYREHCESNASSDGDRRADLMRSHLQTANKLLREYHEYTAELRRRYPFE
jgi:hypothetical protein